MSAVNFDIEALWLSWQDLQTQADAALQEGVAHYFKCMRQTTCDALALEALASSRLGQNDERVFNHLVGLMETYREVISLFETPVKATSPDLVAGLCDVLGSRLRQFEDELAGQGNPVAKEKHTILENAIISAANHIENLEKSYLADDFLQPESSLSTILRQELLAGNPATAWQSLHESIIGNTLQSLQSHYTQTLQTCLTNIDDLHTRKTAAYYTDLLEREWEVLGLIIQVQVKAIESLFEAAEDDASYDIHPILSKLREAYQQTGPVVSGLRKMMQASTTLRKSPDSTGEDFAQTITAGITAPASIAIDSEAFMNALLPIADELFENIRTYNLGQIDNLRQEIKNKISLAEEVISTFEKAGAGLAAIQKEAACSIHFTEALPNNTYPIKESIDNNIADSAILGLPLNSSSADNIEELTNQSQISEDASILLQSIEEPTDATSGNVIEHTITQELPAPENHNIDNEILTGITETLEIKVESLAENLNVFTENTESLLADLPKGLPILSEENLLTAANQLLSAWCNISPTPETIAGFFEESVTLEAFASYSGQFAKHITNLSAKIEKASLRFKKETLLYEISTYEEILYHSVSRLKESPAPHIITAVSLLDDIFTKLESLLIENGITVIRPAAHEPFNGREHEVLIAEETEGFAKGEIVKVMTSGYKYKDQVILRANVIAAR